MGFGRPAIQLIIEDPFDPDKLPRDGTAMITGTMVEVLDQVLPPHMQETLYEATESLGELAAALTPVARNLARLLEAREVQKVDLEELSANIDTVIQRLDTTLRNVNSVIGDEQNQANFGVFLSFHLCFLDYLGGRIDSMLELRKCAKLTTCSIDCDVVLHNQVPV